MSYCSSKIIDTGTQSITFVYPGNKAYSPAFNEIKSFLFTPGGFEIEAQCIKPLLQKEYKTATDGMNFFEIEQSVRTRQNFLKQKE